MNVFEYPVLDFFLKFADFEESQLYHAAVRILVLNAGDFVSDNGHDPQFFFQFAAQGVARLFAVFNFSAGKFPFQTAWSDAEYAGTPIALPSCTMRPATTRFMAGQLYSPAVRWPRDRHNW